MALQVSKLSMATYSLDDADVVELSVVLTVPLVEECGLEVLRTLGK